MKLIHIVGCRPNFIKLAPVYRAAKDKCEQIIIHTGQHYNYEMSGAFFKELELPEPNINLGVQGGLHGIQTGEMLRKIELGLLSHKPEETIIVVYGDTNSTLAGALAAKKLKFIVAHVEAYARSWDRSMPEEINREAIDSIADINFVATLQSDKLSPSRLNHVGDVMYDQFLWAQDKLKPKEDCEYILVTIHREENTEPERFKKIEEAISKLSGLIYWPRHPRTENPSPVSYLQMLSKIRDAKLVITDSGGVQKEAFWSQVPCLTVRKQTEWAETIRQGWNKLVEPDEIAQYINWHQPLKNYVNPYGDGKAAERIVNILLLTSKKKQPIL